MASDPSCNTAGYFTTAFNKYYGFHLVQLFLFLFFVEGYGTEYGLGYYILDAWSRINYIDMYLGIMVISLMGFVLFVLIDFLSDQLCKWSNTAE